MKIGSLFSGIGGIELELGLESLGMGIGSTIWQAENDPNRVTVADVIGRSRIAAIARVLFACYAAMEAAGWSQSRIARDMDRDHSTISHGIAVHERRPLTPETIDTNARHA